MKPSSADAATTAGLARYPSPPNPMRFCQLRLNDVIARWPGVERIRSLTETRTTPRLANLAADRSEDFGDRFAAEPRIRRFDLTADATGARKDRELTLDSCRALLARRTQHQRSLQQIVVAAVGARADQRLVE